MMRCNTAEGLGVLAACPYLRSTPSATPVSLDVTDVARRRRVLFITAAVALHAKLV